MEKSINSISKGTALTEIKAISETSIGCMQKRIALNIPKILFLNNKRTSKYKRKLFIEWIRIFPRR
jgi:hypothetical protein